MANQNNKSDSTMEEFKAPDSLGASLGFLLEFLTQEMFLDFPAIQKEFLKNCYNKILSSQIQFPDGLDNKKTSFPTLDITNRILIYMYNGAKTGDEYCVSLIKYLYKTYHKKEYNQLKKFRRITEKDVFSLAESENGTPAVCTMALILEMCQFLGIEIDSSCSSVYEYLDKYYEFYLQHIAENIEQEDEPVSTSSAILITKRLSSLSLIEYSNFNKSLNDTWTIVEKCLNIFNFPSNFLQSCSKDDLIKDCILVHSILTKINPDKDITLEETFRHVPLIRLTKFIIKYWGEFQDTLSSFFGKEVSYQVRELPNFDTKQPETKTPVKVSKVVAPAKTEEITSEEYLEEIASLRAKLHEKEKETKWLKEFYHDAKSGQEKYESLQKDYENQREELIALREFAYRSSKGFEELPEMTIAEMQKAIETKEIIIIGGHVNWINKIQKTFPNWEIIPANASRTVDANILADKERVYFFTDYIDHRTYGKYVAICREKQIPFGYLHSVNIETMTQQIYEDMCE